MSNVFHKHSCVSVVLLALASAVAACSSDSSVTSSGAGTTGSGGFGGSGGAAGAGGVAGAGGGTGGAAGAGGAGGVLCEPSDETCDGKDNDCDGVVDEGCACSPGQTQPCYSGDAATQNVGACKDGVQACETGGVWGACAGEVLPSTEACNGIDDDCNGATDEALGEQSCGLGACTVVVPACDNGQVPACVPLPGAPFEICDGFVDDTCDGLIDESCSCINGQSQPCYTGPMGTAGAGVCKEGQSTCVSGMWDACQGEVIPSPEACNGLDDDCNGAADDGADASCPALPHATTSCNAGMCGLSACTGTFADCNQNPADGCEKDLSSSNDACGVCGKACLAGQSCYAGACSVTCATNQPMPFPVQGCTNIALGKTYAANGSYLSQLPPLAADGNQCTSWNAGNYPPAWWQVDLGADKPIRGVTLQPAMVPTPASVTHLVQTSSDGTTWTTRLTISQVMAAGAFYPFDFNTTYTARYVRIQTTSSPSWVSWVEVAVWSCP